MRLYILLAVFMGAIFAPVRAQEDHATWLSFEPEIVALDGYLELKQFYGPPGYGENPKTDQVETALIITLSTPISVRGDSGNALNAKSLENITHVQLNCANERIDCLSFANKNIRVTGTLFAAHSGHRFARLLIDVRELSGMF